jgi:pyridoxal phosphate enzyme (YggS family)
MESAAVRTGRDPAGIQLVVVSKYRSLEEISEVLEAGERDLAENRVQDARDKVPRVNEKAAEKPVWHFVGHLQTNKAKYVTQLFDMVHSVDSLRVAEALEEACEKQGRECLDVLLQVNVSGEASKFGMEPEEAESVLAAAAVRLRRLRIRGLMTMAPFELEPEETRPVFRALRELRDRLSSLGLSGVRLEDLSMGMTNDFEVAIEEGATLIRIGTAVFEGF